MIISLSGAPGCGKTTTQAALAKAIYGTSLPVHRSLHSQHYETIRQYLTERGFQAPSLVAAAEKDEKAIFVSTERSLVFLKELILWQLNLLKLHTANAWKAAHFLSTSPNSASIHHSVILDRSAYDSLAYFLYDLARCTFQTSDVSQENIGAFICSVLRPLHAFYQKLFLVDKEKTRNGRGCLEAEEETELSEVDTFYDQQRYLLRDIREEIKELLPTSSSATPFDGLTQNEWASLVHILHSYVGLIYGAAAPATYVLLHPLEELQEDGLRTTQKKTQLGLHSCLLYTALSFLYVDSVYASEVLQEEEFENSFQLYTLNFWCSDELGDRFPFTFLLEGVERERDSALDPLILSPESRSLHLKKAITHIYNVHKQH